MAAIRVRSHWKRIDAWLNYRVPRMWLESPGLSESEIRKAEKKFGHRLPDDIRQSYMIHNGLVGVEIYASRCCVGYFLPLIGPTKTWPGIQRRNSIESWERWNADLESGRLEDAVRPKGPIQKVRWCPNWLPIFDNEQGDYLLLDMQPLKGGAEGQIVEFRRWEGPYRVLTRRFSDWLGKFADDLERDRYHLQLGDFNANLIRDTEWKRLKEEEHEEYRRTREAVDRLQRIEIAERRRTRKAQNKGKDRNRKGRK